MKIIKSLQSVKKKTDSKENPSLRRLKPPRGARNLYGAIGVLIGMSPFEPNGNEKNELSRLRRTK